MRWGWLALLLLSPSVVRADAPRTQEARELNDFAEGLSLALQPGLSVQTLLVPLEVYQGTREGHPDLAVFNPRGEAVPFALRSLRSKTQRHEEELTVPLFPLRQPEGRAPGGGALRMQIRRDDAGTILEVASPEPARARTKVFAYLLDASKLEHPFDRVRLTWDSVPDSFQIQVQVQGSDDLASWQALSGGAVLGELRHAGQSIERREILIAPSRAKYLRLIWEGELPVNVRSAQLRVERNSVEQEAPRMKVLAQTARAADHEYLADLRGILPVTAIALRLPEDTLVMAGLSLRTQLEQPLRPLINGQFYRVRHAGVELKSPPTEIDFVPTRYISLAVDSRTDAIFNDLAFEVEYAPEQLLLLTRGDGLYTLAFGSYKPAAPAFDADKLLEFMPEATREQLPVQSVRVVGAVALAGDGARREPLPPHSYRMQVLWGVLIVGAGLLVWLALRLLRRMER